MLRDVFFKSLRDQRRSLVWWSLGVAAYVAFLVPFYPTIKKSAVDLGTYLENLPEVLRTAFMGSGGDYASPLGYLNTELFSWLVPLVFIVFGVGAGARALAGDEETGTLSLLLSYPLSRRRLVLQKSAALAVALLVVATAFYVSLLIAVSAVGMEVSAGTLLEGVALGGLLGLAVGSISLTVATATGRRAMGIAVAAAVGVASYLLNTIALLSDEVRPFRVLSFFHYYGGATPLSSGVTWSAAVVFLGTMAVMLAATLVLFERRGVTV